MPEPIEPKEVRYFFIAYTGRQTITGGEIIGNLAFNSMGFPSLLWITEQLVPEKVNKKINSVVVTHLYEFKSEADFNEFCLGWDAMDNINNFLQN